jgi:acyl-CoA thioesterase-2
MTSPVSELIELLSLERLEDNLFRGQSRDIGTRYVFGGQVLGQALSAAQATIDPATGSRAAHSLHAYFLRAGDIEHPIVYDVDRTRDGGTFSVRRVTAIQHGKVIFFCAASFQVAEDGAQHQLTMPEVPKPEDIAAGAALSPEALAALPTKVQRWLSRDGTVRVPPRLSARRTEPAEAPALPAGLVPPVGAGRRRAGAASRAAGLCQRLPPAGHRDLPARDQLLPAGRADGLARPRLWFHRDFRADDWLLYSIDSPSSAGLAWAGARADLRPHGRLVASTAQEGLIRVVPPQAVG